MPALGSNQLLVLILSGLLLASGAALVVAENPSNDTADDLGDQTRENTNSDDRKKGQDPNTDPDDPKSEWYSSGKERTKEGKYNDPAASGEYDWDLDENGQFFWDCDEEGGHYGKANANGQYYQDGDPNSRPDDRPGNDYPDRDRPNCDDTNSDCQRQRERQGERDRERQQYCQRLRELLGDPDRDPNVRPDGTDRPYRDERPQHDFKLWVTAVVTQEGVLILAGGPNGPLPGVAIWMDNLPRPFITNEQGWLWLDEAKEGCHVVKALYQPGDRWSWAQTKFCLKEGPEPPEPPKERLELKIELLDRDDDGFTELVLIHVYGPDGAPVEGAKVIVDGQRAGETGPRGLADYRVERGGDHWVEVGYGEMWVEREFWVEPRDDPDPEPRFGVIEGVVIGFNDDEEWRVHGALVQLRPADNWREEFARTETCERGGFRFGEVPAGEWELRVSHEDYHVAEVIVEVIAGKPTVVTIELEEVEPEPEPPHMWIEVTEGDLGLIAIVGVGEHRIQGANVKLDGTYLGQTNEHGVISLGDPEPGEHWVTARWESPYGDVYEAEAEFFVEEEPDPEPSPWVFTVKVQQRYYAQFTVKDEEGEPIDEAPIYVGDELLGHTTYNGIYYHHIYDWEPGTYTAWTIDPEDQEYVVTFVIEEPEPTITLTAEVFAGGQDGTMDDVRLRVTNANGYGIDDVAVHMGNEVVGYTNVYGYLHLYDLEDGEYTAWVTVENITEDVHWVIDTQ